MLGILNLTVKLSISLTHSRPLEVCLAAWLLLETLPI